MRIAGGHGRGGRNDGRGFADNRSIGALAYRAVAGRVRDVTIRAIRGV